MIHTVFCTSSSDAVQWQAELLEFSWRRVRQPGELVRLVAADSGGLLPNHRLAHVVPTLRWSPHPYTGDRYAGYQQIASLLDWLLQEGVDGTVLLVEPHCVFRAPIEREVAPGHAVASAWSGLPRVDLTPFALGADYQFLERFCVNRSLVPPAVTLPLLIHSSDLRRIAPRWLELTGILREELRGKPIDASDADRIAYAVAAAEAEVEHEVQELVLESADRSTRHAAEGGAPILSYREPIESQDGRVLFDRRRYLAWQTPEALDAATPAARELLAMLADFAGRREQGGDLAVLRPVRRVGVREARVLDQMVLDVPSRADSLSLNPSASAIWQLCDGHRTLYDIACELEARFGVPSGGLHADVEATAEFLQKMGSLELDMAIA
jgi:hypothetical protein